MKKILFSIVVLFGIGLSIAPVYAQSYCSLVDATNAFSCCDTADGSYTLNQIACDDYLRGGTPGTVGSGTPGTNPTNTGIPTGSTGTGSNTSANELAQCSAIKFLSLLDILIWIKCIIVVAFIPLVFAAAFFFFLWGILRFMAASDSTRKEAARKYILWGLIGLFVMVSLWGIIRIVSNVFGLDSSVVPVLQTEYLKK